MAKTKKQQPQQLLVFEPPEQIPWTDRCPRCNEYVGQENLTECPECGMTVCSGCLVETASGDRCLDCVES